MPSFRLSDSSVDPTPCPTCGMPPINPTPDQHEIARLKAELRIAHEQREVIRQLAGALKDLIPCMEAAFSSEGDAFGILHNDATDALSAAEVAFSVAAPYLKD